MKKPTGAKREKKSVKLTKTIVDAAQPADKEWFIWDVEPKGFGVKIFPSGTKTFVFQYRLPEGRSKRLTIGKYSGSKTVDQARKDARRAYYAVHGGGDPMAEKQSRRQALTIDEMLDLYVESEQFTSNAPSTQSIDLGRMKHHLRPLLGNQFADNVTPAQVAKAQRDITVGKTAARVKTKARGVAKVKGGEGTAGKAVVLLSAAYTWAVKNKFAKANPAADIKVKPSGQRDTIVETPKQYASLFTTLQKMETEKRIRPAVADLIRFVVLTGVRRGEATGLQWQWVNLKTGMIVLPAKQHKTGHKSARLRYIGLPAEARAIISRQPKGEPDSRVFRPAKGVGPIALGKIWPDVRTEAKLPAKLGLHGLRHSIGTSLAVAGASPVELMEVLGHRQVSTTMKYIHFAERARSNLATRAASVAMRGLNSTTKKAKPPRVANKVANVSRRRTG